MSNVKKSSSTVKSSAARLAAVQAVYQILCNSESEPASVVQEYVHHRLGMPIEDDKMVAPDTELFTRIVGGVFESRDVLMPVIASALEKGRGDVSDLLLKSILLCGACELFRHHEIDAPIVISDYMNVTDGFYDTSEKKLVNAVLDQVKQSFKDG